MSRFLRCDSCGKEGEADRAPTLGDNYSFIWVEANEDSDHGQLCSWSCLALWAMSKALRDQNAPAGGAS